MTACTDCEGCGQVADTDEREPWTAWASLPPGSDLAVRLGMVRPMPCPRCAGGGTEPAPAHAPTGVADARNDTDA